MQNKAPASSTDSAASGKKLPLPSNNGGFVVHLAASTTPVTLVQPDHPALKAYTFFVSRRREDRRERFRLHMGYFESQQDAEQMLELVRDIFPAAWAGVAPGRNLNTAAGVANKVQPAVLELPQIKLSEPAPSPSPLPPPAPAPATTPPVRPVAPKDTKALVAPSLQPVPVAPQSHQEAAASLDSVRAAIAALSDDTGSARALRNNATAQTASQKLLSESQSLRLLQGEPPIATTPTPKRVAPPPVARQAAANLPAAPTPAAPPPAASPATAPQSPTPAFAGFAVQLQWSVQPIVLSQLPALAIFEAYTLYCAEGRNDSRSWHGLRLGFFTDADSAKQVANYVRSEFPSVSVVPVTVEERDGAKRAQDTAKLQPPAEPPAKSAFADMSGEFKLIDDAKAATQEKASAVATVQKPDAESPAPAHGATPEAKVSAPGAKPSAPTTKSATAPAPARRAPLSIEETLEILGANTLRLEGKGGEALSASASAAMENAARRGKPAQKSKLGQLFERLAERIGG